MRLALTIAMAGLCLGGPGQGSAQNRRVAVSPAGARLIAFDMPRGWRLIGDAANPFRASSIIATSRTVMHGTALPPRNHAAIQIGPITNPDVNEQADRLLRREAIEERVLSSRNLPDRVGSDADCSNPAEVLFEWEVAPRVHARQLLLICRRDGIRFEVRLDYWPGDARAEAYRRRALAVTRSLRFVPQRLPR